MMSLVALLLLATSALQAAAVPETKSTFEVDDVGYINALLNVAIAAIQNTTSGVTVSLKQYVVDFQHKSNQTTKSSTNYVLSLDKYGLVAFPNVSVYGDVLWWGNSSIFHIYADFIFGNHTVYYEGEVGLPGNMTPCYINLTKIDYIASTYKKFVYNKTSSTYDLQVHILDAKSYGEHYYNISIPNASSELLHAVHEEVHKINLKAVRDYTLTALTDYVLAIMDEVDISEYISIS